MSASLERLTPRHRIPEKKFRHNQVQNTTNILHQVQLKFRENCTFSIFFEKTNPLVKIWNLCGDGPEIAFKISSELLIELKGDFNASCWTLKIVLQKKSATNLTRYEYNFNLIWDYVTTISSAILFNLNLAGLNQLCEKSNLHLPQTRCFLCDC